MDHEATPHYYIGLDIGTSSAKAVAFANDGRALHSAAFSYDLQHPEPEAAVQDAGLVRQAALDSLRQLLHKMERPPRAIGLSSAMHSLLAVDADGTPLGPLITWADGRAQEQAAVLRGTPEGKQFYRDGGTPIHAMAPICKLAWMKQHQEEIFRCADKFVGIKDFLLHHCFGEWLIDHSLASATGLFDLRQRDWMPQALAYLALDAERLPRPVPPHTLLSGLREEVATDLGLAREIPWVIGASDGCLANLGANLSEAGDAVLTIGTSGAIRRTVSGAVYDPLERLFCYILDEEQYVIGGATNNGGVVWEWFCEQFYPDRTMEEVFTATSSIPAGAEGLLFLPYIHGERAPVWDASAKGYFWNIEAHHSRDHFAKAVLEGICLNLLQISEALEAVSGPIERIHANGGFVRSEVGVQLLADVLGKTMIVRAGADASAWGAAMMAMRALGEDHPGTEASFEKIYQPNRERHERYQDIFPAFKSIYPSASVS